MKREWEKVRNKLDDLERTDKLDWKSLSIKDLKIVSLNSHRRERKHWLEPVSDEIKRRRHRQYIIIAIVTLVVTIAGLLISIF